MIGPQISTSLVDNSTHAGKAKEYASAPLKITDATVNMLNQRAKGMGFSHKWFGNSRNAKGDIWDS